MKKGSVILHEEIKNIIADKNVDWQLLDGATFFITGATGLIGSSLIKAIIEYDHKNNMSHKIYAQVRNLGKAHNIFGDTDYIEYVVGDIRDEISVDGCVDYIIHCASVTASKTMIEDPKGTFEIAVKGTEHVLKLAKEKAVKSMVYVSSMEVYGQITVEQNPITEDKMGYIDETNPRSCYPLAKRECEKMCLTEAKTGLPVKMVRLAQTLGNTLMPDDNRMPAQFVRNVAKGQDIVLHTEGKSMVNFCHIDDAISGILTVLLKGENGEAYNVCNDKETRTVKEIAELVANDAAKGVGLRPVQVVFDIPAGGNVHGYAADSVMMLSAEKLSKLGWTPKTDLKVAYKNAIVNSQ